MSKKVLELVKIAAAMVKKVDEHLEALARDSTNAEKSLEFGSQGAVALYQTVLAMQKKGTKGDKLSDYNNPNIPKFLKEIESAKTKCDASVKAYNTGFKQLDGMKKMVKALDDQVGGLAKDKDIAKNPEAIKLLVDVRKKVMAMEKLLVTDAMGTMSDLGKFIKLSPSMKISDVKDKLPMDFVGSLKTWQEAGSKIDKKKRGFREIRFDQSMKLAGELA